MKNWQDTRFTKRLGITYPIIQGPFGGGFSSARLAATVSNGGGLGSFGMAQLTSEEILETAGEIRSLSPQPFNLNLWVTTHDEGASSRTMPNAS